LAQSLQSLPVSLFSAAMGLAGLGLACRGAALPGALADFWIALGTMALAFLLPAYAAKVLRYPREVREEFTNPALLGFCGAPPVALILVAAGIAPWARNLAEALWWPGVALLLAFQLWMLVRLLSGAIAIAQVNGGWLIVLVGGIVVPTAGLPLGHPEISAYTFGVSAAMAPFVVGLLLYRTLFGPPLPAPFRPTLFIVLVPPSLIYANGTALAAFFGEPDGIFLQGLFFLALPLAAALLIASRDFLRWPFGPPWWAFTFPLDSLAGAAARYARGHPAGPWPAVAAAALALAAFFVVLVLYRTLAALLRRQSNE
jgi:tellurite resistance protein